MEDNFEYSKEWLTRKIIEQDFEGRKNKKTIYVKIKYTDLLRMVLKFVNLNERS